MLLTWFWKESTLLCIPNIKDIYFSVTIRVPLHLVDGLIDSRFPNESFFVLQSSQVPLQISPLTDFCDLILQRWTRRASRISSPTNSARREKKRWVQATCSQVKSSVRRSQDVTTEENYVWLTQEMTTWNLPEKPKVCTDSLHLRYPTHSRRSFRCSFRFQAVKCFSTFCVVFSGVETLPKYS